MQLQSTHQRYFPSTVMDSPALCLAMKMRNPSQVILLIYIKHVLAIFRAKTMVYCISMQGESCLNFVFFCLSGPVALAY